MKIHSRLAAVLLSALPLAALAAPYDGSSPANAGLSAAQILNDYAGSITGLYWIDFDGAGAGAPVTFAILGASIHPATLGNDFLIVA